MKKLKVPKSTKNFLKGFLPYFLSGAAIVALVALGSMDKYSSDTRTPIMLAISNNNYDVSMDQISELNMIAQIAANNNLVSSQYLNMDYISAVAQYAINQSSAASSIEKPHITDTGLSRGIVVYTVVEGDTMASIAAARGLTTDQIRWSNGLKTTNLSVGDTLYLPGMYGIVYTVKNGETIESIAKKTGSPYDQIVHYNDLEESGITEGMRITLPNGTLPAVERPEYVAPVRYYNLRSTGNNPMPWGWCTWYAWQWRYDNMPANYHLPGGLGNARYWDNQLYGRFYIDRTPRYGDVFVSEGGYYGHVGIVTAVNGDGTINIADMNGRAGWGRVGTRTVDSSEWRQWNFIHQAIGS